MLTEVFLGNTCSSHKVSKTLEMEIMMEQLNIDVSVQRHSVANSTFDGFIREEFTAEELLLFNFNRLVARCILTQRQKLNMTQEELAQKSGVSRMTISAIEKRKRVISTEILLKLLDALNVDIHFVER
jgi:DNA-binding XRE family transcriptional regulator